MCSSILWSGGTEEHETIVDDSGSDSYQSG